MTNRDASTLNCAVTKKNVLNIRHWRIQIDIGRWLMHHAIIWITCFYIQVIFSPLSWGDTTANQLVIVFEGETASSDLGAALIHLRRHYRSIVIDRNPKLYDEFWKPAVALGAWPENAFQPQEVAKAYVMERKQSSGRPRYAIPKVQVSTIPGRIRASAPKVPLNARVVSPETEQKICEKYPPALTSNERKKCIVGLVPNVGVFSERKVKGTSPNSVVREVILEIGAYALRIDSIRSIAQRRKLTQELEIVAHGRVPPDPKKFQQRAVSDVRELSVQPDCSTTAAMFASALDSQRQLSRWPNDKARRIANANLLVADPEIEEAIYWEERKEPPKLVEKRVKHPYLKTSATSPQLGCSALLLSGKGARNHPWQHAVGVASAVFGRETLIGEIGAGERKISGLLEPSRDEVINYSPPLRWQVGKIPPKAVIVAAFDNSASEPFKESVSEMIDNGKKGVGAFIPVVSGSTVIIAAPLLRSEYLPVKNYFDIDNNKWRTGKAPCIDWPACLGASPFALVVAPLDNKGNLMEVEPATGKKYRLESTVTALAAPGQDIVTAATDSDNTAQFALQSGSSLAVASVAAVALRLRENGFQGSGIELMARIAATSDLTSISSDKVRFGKLNATRALLGRGGGQDSSYVLPLTAQETEDVQTTAELEACLIEGGSYPPYCKDQERAPEGWLLFYKEGEDKATPTCVPVHHLLRIRKTGANETDDPLYTIVYYKGGTEKFNNIKYPHIERDVRIGAWAAVHECQETNGDPNTPDVSKKPCLTRRDNHGIVHEIDLTRSDIVFNSWQADETVARPRCGRKRDTE